MTTEAETRLCIPWCGEKDGARQCNAMGCYFGDGRHWCSPGCRDAGRRLGDAPAEVVHAANPDAAATRCGLPFTADLRLSPKRSRTTCPACLTAMAEPRVVSGLDTAAAPAEPVHAFDGGHFLIRIGDRTRCGADITTGLLFSSVAVAVTCPTCLGQSTPVETPPTATRKCEPWCGRPNPTGERCACNYLPCYRTVPGQPCRCSLDCAEAGQRVDGTTYDGPPLAAPAAPAPGVGEGRTSWPFSVKLESIASPESAQAVVRSLPLLAQRLGLTVDIEINGVAMFVVPGDTADDADARWKSRAKKSPEPLPAPAPRVSRVAEMVAEAIKDNRGPLGEFTARGLCLRVVEAHQEEIRRLIVSYRRSNEDTDDIDDLLSRARAAMLEPR
jgi:hypothetical protein